MRVSIEVPEVAYKGPNDTDFSVYLAAAWRLRRGFEAGGSNVKTAIALILERVAEQLTQTDVVLGDYDRYGRLHVRINTADGPMVGWLEPAAEVASDGN